MKRILCSFLLLASLIAGMIQPIFAAEEAAQEPDEVLLTEAASEGAELAASGHLAPNVGDRSSEKLTLSAAGLAFVTEMMGAPKSGAVAEVEKAVNLFSSVNGISLTQPQFDALIDLCLEYGAGILEYRCGQLIVAGGYTDAELATAFCAWVKHNGTFDQNKLNRRLRQIKLFLYGSYDGVCDANFRYVVFYPNGGSLNNNTVLCYPLGQPYGDLPMASRSGKYFAGWYTAADGGDHIYNSMTVTGNYAVYAHWSNKEVTYPNDEGMTGYPSEWPELRPLKISEAGIQFIKDHEGFIEYPKWDYSQYTVGYGTRYDPANAPIKISSPITEAEADYLLRHMLADFEAVLERHLQKATVKHTQQQYDVLVSLTFNLGQQWLKESYVLYQYVLYGGYTEMDFVNSLGKWCNAGGNVLTGLAKRRMDEAHLYLNGEYTLGTKTYLFVQFNGAKGEPAVKYRYYKTGAPMGELPTAYREGHKLVGWYSKVTGGTHYTAETIAPANSVYTLYAHWEEGEPEETPEPSTDPTEPPTAPTTQPTEPPTESTNPPTTQPTTPPTTTHTQFSDVKNTDWYYDYVTRAVAEGLFSGVSETKFQPNGNMTRAMLATVLYRIAGQPEVKAKTPFTDVAAGQWYSNAISWAYENNIVNGVSADKFGVNGYVTREQLTTMLLRYANLRGCAGTDRADLSSFSDRGKVSSFATESMHWAVAMGIMNGDNGRLNPQGNATRAQCAKMLVCFLDLMEAG